MKCSLDVSSGIESVCVITFIIDKLPLIAVAQFASGFVMRVRAQRCEGLSIFAVQLRRFAWLAHMFEVCRWRVALVTDAVSTTSLATLERFLRGSREQLDAVCPQAIGLRLA